MRLALPRLVLGATRLRADAQGCGLGVGLVRSCASPRTPCSLLLRRGLVGELFHASASLSAPHEGADAAGTRSHAPPPPSTATCRRGRVTRPGRAPIAWGDASLPSPRSCMCPRALCARQERVDRALPTFFSRFSAHFPVPPPFFMHTHTFHICSLHLLLMYARYDVSWVHVARARCAGRARATCPRGDARHASRPMRAARGWCPIRASPGAGGWR